MAPGYVLAQVTMHDPESYKKYVAAVTGIVHSFGGEYLARGGANEVMEGTPVGDRYVIIKFDSMDTARRFYHSPEYQAIIHYRTDASEGLFVMVEGLE